MAAQRLFAALYPPAEALDDLARVVAPLRDVEPGVRWAPREGWHVTLAFMPAVAPEDVDGLVDALGRATSASPPLRLVLTGGGAFPRPHRARVVWAGIGGDLAALQALAAGCHRAITARGLAVSPAAFRPHLTLARARRAPVRAERLISGLSGYAGTPWTADTLVLVRSRLGAGEGGRPRHEVRASLPLSA